MDGGKRSTQGPDLETVHLSVHVTPRGGRDAVIGWSGSVLRVRLAAPPVDGRANEALVRFLAGVAGVPPAKVRLTGGERSRDKRVTFDGVDRAALRERLGCPGGGLGR